MLRRPLRHWRRLENKMNTSTLVVGQEVEMCSGCYFDKGKVIKVTLSGVEVETRGQEVFRFDANGRGCDGHRTYECGPWELVEPMG